MRLNELSIDAQHILRTLHFSGAGLRRNDIAEQTGLTLEQISPHLSRLKAKGLLKNEVVPGSNGTLWTVSESGHALVSDVAFSEITASIHGPMEPNMEPEPAMELEPVPTDAVAIQLLTAMEIEVALDRLRHQLRLQRIPAQTARVYREVVAALPPVLAHALAPLTALLESAP